ncbi:MAG: TRAM domain-containing protein [Deltaproteobacteria bacterium]|nr:TRAM domain-containing protein [Deltaproteobacteria bacterium]
MKYLVAVLLVLSLVFAGTAMVCAETLFGIELGKVYDVNITEEMENQWIGANGVGKIGDGVVVYIPDAEEGEKYKIKVNAIEENPFTGDQEAKFDVVSGP